MYLDNLILFSDSLEERLKRLDIVFKRLKECNRKLNLKNCKLLQIKVKYVGHIVSENSVEPDPEKTNKVKNWSKPKMLRKIPHLQDITGDLKRLFKSSKTFNGIASK